MRPIEAEARALEIVNAVDGLLTSLPADAPSGARKALTDGRDALRRAADAFADAAEGERPSR